MIGTLYRYPNPLDPMKFIYVGQGANRDRFHRSGKSAFGRRFKEKFPGCILPEPIKERISIANQIQLNEKETDWIFYFHTWYQYPGGMNLTLPGSVDYMNLGRITGRIHALTGHLNNIRTPETCSLGGRIGGRRRIELYGNPSTPEGCRKGGQTAGKINGRKATESGQLAKIQTPENRRKAGQVNIESGHAHRLGNSGVGLCKRWKVNRGKPCVCGQHAPFIIREIV